MICAFRRENIWRSFDAIFSDFAFSGPGRAAQLHSYTAILRRDGGKHEVEVSGLAAPVARSQVSKLARLRAGLGMC